MNENESKKPDQSQLDPKVLKHGLLSLSISTDDWDSLDWQKVTESVELPLCENYAKTFASLVNNDPTSKIDAILSFLREICGLSLQDGLGTEPLKHLFAYRNRRTITPQDLTNNDFCFLGYIFDHTNDPELKARCGDLLWTQQRDHVRARSTIEAYMESAKRIYLSSSKTLCAAIRIERAIAFAYQLKDRKLLVDIQNWLRNSIDSNDPSVWSRRALQILSKLNPENPEELASIAESLAEKAASIATSAARWPHIRIFWQISIAYWRQAKNEERVSQAKFRESQTYEKEADTVPDGPSCNAIKAEFLMRAVEAYRRVGDKPAAKAVHERLLVHQEKAMEEIKTFSLGQVDLHECAHAAIVHVSDLNLGDALRAFALLNEPPDPNDIRNQYGDFFNANPLSAMLDKQIIDHRGRVVARIPGNNDHDAENNEAIDAWIQGQAQYSRNIQVLGIIEPARVQIFIEHAELRQMLFEMAYCSPFVPADHSQTFARTIYAGFAADWPLVAHFLPPQLEACLRKVLNDHNIITSTVSDENTQEEHLLKALLEHEKTPQILGKNHHYALQGILLERSGFNLRNRVMHGLCPDNELCSADIVYLWWLAFRLSVIPILNIIDASESDEKNENGIPSNM